MECHRKGELTAFAELIELRITTDRQSTHPAAWMQTPKNFLTYPESSMN
jgi:hypothetical protein